MQRPDMPLFIGVLDHSEARLQSDTSPSLTDVQTDAMTRALLYIDIRGKCSDLGRDELANITDIRRHFRCCPIARMRQVDCDIGDDAPWTTRHDDDSVSEKHGFGNAVGNEDDQFWLLGRDRQELVLHRFARHRVESAKWLVQ